MLAKDPQLTLKEIADRLGVVERTVWNDLSVIYKNTKYKDKDSLLQGLKENPNIFGEKDGAWIEDLTQTEMNLCAVLAQNLVDDAESIATKAGVSSADLAGHLKETFNKIHTNGQQGFFYNLKETAARLLQEQKSKEIQWVFSPIAHGLTKKEYKICKAVRQNPGKSRKELACILRMHESTLKNHFTSIYRKAAVESYRQLEDLLHKGYSRVPQGDAIDQYAAHCALTRTEKKLFVLLVENPSYTNKGISSVCHKFEYTTRNHLTNIFRKARVESLLFPSGNMP